MLAIRPRLRNILSILALSYFATGCGGSGGIVPIEETQTVTAPRPSVDPNATTATRLMGQTMPAASGSAPQSGGRMFDYETPEGWQELPPTDLRLVNLKPAGNPDAECTVSLLPGGGGGMAENINRWRGQMGQPAYSPAEIDALPKSTLLGREAVLVSFDGEYSGMGGGPGKPNFTLTGIILNLPNAGVFVKMVGPKETIAAEADKFVAFCQSLRLASSESEPGHEGHNHAPGEHDPHASSGDMTWETPEGWQTGPEKPMRLVTLLAGPDSTAECYIIILPGDAGGVYSNFDRWAKQMGQNQTLSPETVQALPVIPVLGADAPMIELTGTYTDMSGTVTDGAMLLGVIAKKGDQSVFIRMTGPEAAVKEQKQNFIAFCKSLK
ncbi:MAG: hypothetical protein AMXMBFR84_08380 [Candidatus Hydrogenedentota bacterium]